jgi:hypothetical protein
VRQFQVEFFVRVQRGVVQFDIVVVFVGDNSVRDAQVGRVTHRA